MENAGPGCGVSGSWSVENAGSGGKRGVWWKTRGPVENAGFGGKRGVRWKTRGLVENAWSVWRTQGLMWKTQGTLFFAKICTFLTKMRGQNIVS